MWCIYVEMVEKVFGQYILSMEKKERPAVERRKASYQFCLYLFYLKPKWIPREENASAECSTYRNY